MKKDVFYQKGVKQLNDRSRSIKCFVLAGDIIVLIGTLLLVYYSFATLFHHKGIITPILTLVTIAILCYLPCVSTIPIIVHHRFVKFGRIVRRTFILCTYFVLINLSVLTFTQLLPDSRLFLVVFYISFYFLLIFWRVIARILVKMLRIRNRNTRSVLFVGCGSNSYELFYEMIQSPESGYRI